MINILIVEDDTNIRKLMGAVLKQNGFETFDAEDGIVALELMNKHYIDLVVLDLMMPNMDGYELTRQLRLIWKDIPILMVTAKQEAEDKRRGFLVGTDDYMTKPVDEQEMVLRIKALLRRAKIASEHRITLGKVIIDYNSLTVSREQTVITLPQKEFYLLFKLLSYPNMIFTRLQLMDEIWGMENETDDHTLNVHINRLRDRFRDWPEFEIITIRGLGYKVVKKI
ncbi:response regulator transcription factor [Priestia sp. YIM B13490]|uniref:response regulator transcription factor n=1 Tax=Priestia sp. YIM B13490 TaxID=3366310 RepID=UPI00366DAF50